MAKKSSSWIDTLGGWLPGWPSHHRRQADPEIQIRNIDPHELTSASAPARINTDINHEPHVERTRTHSVPRTRTFDQTSESDSEHNSDFEEQYYDFGPDVRQKNTNFVPRRSQHSTPKSPERRRISPNGQIPRMQDRGDGACHRENKSSRPKFTHTYNLRNRSRDRRNPPGGYQYESDSDDEYHGPLPVFDPNIGPFTDKESENEIPLPALYEQEMRKRCRTYDENRQNRHKHVERDSQRSNSRESHGISRHRRGDLCHQTNLIEDTKADMPECQENVVLGFHPVNPQVRMMNIMTFLDLNGDPKEFQNALTREITQSKEIIDADKKIQRHLMVVKSNGQTTSNTLK